MATRKISDKLREAYLQNLEQYGEQGLYQRSIGQGLILLADNPEIDNLLLDYSESFFALHRKTGEESYFTLGKILRRAAHAVYRQIMKQNNARKPNQRFLNVIQ